MRRGNDTTINEAKMLELLRTGDIAKNAQALQTGAYLMLLDAYDRRLSHENLKAYIAQALRLYDATGRLSVMSNMREFKASTGAITDADLMSAEQTAVGLVKQCAAECIKLADLLPQMAGAEDPIS